TGMSEATRRNVEALRARGLVVERERCAKRVRLRRERIATLVGDASAARAAVARAPSQLDALERIIAAGGTLLASQLGRGGALAKLVKTGLVAVSEREIALDAVPIGDGMIVGAIPEPTVEQA